MTFWRATLLLTGLCLVLMPGAVGATLFSPFSGFADLSWVDSEIDGRNQDNFRQEYNVNFNHTMAAWTHLRASVRYYKFDQELEQVLGIYREEFQPSGEFRWDHPLAQLNVRGLRRRVVSTGEDALITQTWQTSLQSEIDDWPHFVLRYDTQKSYDEADLQDRDIHNRRFLASANLETGIHWFNYNYDHLVSENLISDQSSVSDSHNFRWRAQEMPKDYGEVQFSGNYQYSYRQLKNEVAGGGLVLEFVNPAEGLYALSDNPELVTLQPRQGLVDGNTTAPVIPLIDIGGSGTGHNLGGDFPGGESVKALYIYTDRPSGSQVVWEVFGSHDNQTWEQVASATTQSFNPNVNRYELQFDSGNYRFFKAVNSGLNEIALVNVTEVQFLREVPASGGESTQTLVSSAHNLDGRAGLAINEKWDTALDLAMRLEEIHGRLGDRNRASLAWRLSYQPSVRVGHHLRLDGFRQAYDGNTPDLVESHQGYAMLLQPNSFVRGSLSLANRCNWTGGEKTQAIQSAAAQGTATLIKGLDVLLNALASHNQDYFSDRGLNTWKVGTGFEIGPYPSLDINLDASFQESYEVGAGLVSSRLILGGGLTWRLSPKLFFRGSVRQNREQTSRLNLDFMASWNILPNLRLSAQHYELTDDSMTTTLRRSLNLHWDLGNSSRYYLSWGDVDLSGSGGTAVVSFQQGIRIGF